MLQRSTYHRYIFLTGISVDPQWVMSGSSMIRNTSPPSRVAGRGQSSSASPSLWGCRMSYWDDIFHGVREGAARHPAAQILSLKPTCLLKPLSKSSLYHPVQHFRVCTYIDQGVEGKWVRQCLVWTGSFTISFIKTLITFILWGRDVKYYWACWSSKEHNVYF